MVRWVWCGWCSTGGCGTLVVVRWGRRVGVVRRLCYSECDTVDVVSNGVCVERCVWYGTVGLIVGWYCGSGTAGVVQYGGCVTMGVVR